MPRYSAKDGLPSRRVKVLRTTRDDMDHGSRMRMGIAGLPLRSAFLRDFANVKPKDEDYREAKARYPGARKEVLDSVAKQYALAYPILQGELLITSRKIAEIARTGFTDADLRDMETFLDKLDMADLGDAGVVGPEYTCPQCSFTWSGTPHPQYVINEPLFKRNEAPPKPPKPGSLRASILAFFPYAFNPIRQKEARRRVQSFRDRGLARPEELYGKTGT